MELLNIKICGLDSGTGAGLLTGSGLVRGVDLAARFFADLHLSAYVM